MSIDTLLKPHSVVDLEHETSVFLKIVLLRCMIHKSFTAGDMEFHIECEY